VKVLVTGAGGALGREVVRAFAADHEVLALDRGALDVSDRDCVLQTVCSTQPDVVVHLAAWTDVDGCEGDADHAWAVNALGTRHVSEGAAFVGSRLCYVSTDYVFDGLLERPYTEWDLAEPLSVYGQSKRGGELEAASLLGASATIVRTSWLCGREGPNFVKTMLRRAQAAEAVKVVDDQHGCPTFTDDLASVIRTLAVGRRPGLFHATNQGVTTWFHFARDVFAIAGADPDLVSPITSAELDPPRAAPRPANSVLDNTALRLSGLAVPADHHEPLERLVKELMTL
jgi:dTDP-4-dehydrorhamnose reductase